MPHVIISRYSVIIYKIYDENMNDNIALNYYCGSLTCRRYTGPGIIRASNICLIYSEASGETHFKVCKFKLKRASCL
jgi:hypothetical protein